MSDHPQDGSPDPNAPEQGKEPDAAPQTPPPGDGGARPIYLRPAYIGGAVIAVIAIVAAIFLAGPTGKNGQEEDAIAATTANDSTEATGWELGRPGDIVMGSRDAPVKLVEYASVTCGHCAAFQLMVFPDIKKKYIDTGLVQYTLREFPTAPAALSVRGFMLARCAGTDHYYQALDALFRTQPLWIRRNMQESGIVLERISRQFGLDKAQFDACMHNEDELERIKAVVKAGSELYGINGTPSFIINGRKAEIHAATFEALDTAIRESLPEGTQVPEYTPTGINAPESGQPQADEGTADEGTSDEGTSDEGTSDEGTSDEGTSDEGTSDEGTSDDGASDEGATGEGGSDAGGAPAEGASDAGASDDSASDKATSGEEPSDDSASDTSDSGDKSEESAPKPKK